MPYSGAKEFISVLTLTFALYRPTSNEDVSDKGESMMTLVIPNPENPLYAISIDVFEGSGGDLRCAVWFGPVEISGYTEADDVTTVVEDILNDRAVTVLRYKTRDTYDDRHPTGNWQKIFWLVEGADRDGQALEAFLTRMATKPTLADRLLGNRTGIFEVARWSGVTVIERN